MKRFTAFLHSLWGILAGISVFFPLSNSLIKKGVPLAKWDESGGFAILPVELVTAITTLAAIFVVFWTYGQRDMFRSGSHRPRVSATRSFIVGVASLVLYVAGYCLMQRDFHTVLGWDSEDVRRLLFDLILLVLYAASFCLITRAFTLLAGVEYFNEFEESYRLGND